MSNLKTFQGKIKGLNLFYINLVIHISLKNEDYSNKIKVKLIHKTMKEIIHIPSIFISKFPVKEWRHTWCKLSS